MEYKRLTERICGAVTIKDEYGDAISFLDREANRVVDRLAELEDKIEQGTLKEIPEGAVARMDRKMFNEIANDILLSVKPVYLRKEIVCKMLDLIDRLMVQTRKETAEKIADWLDNEKGYCGLGYLIKREFCTEEKDND